MVGGWNIVSFLIIFRGCMYNYCIHKYVTHIQFPPSPKTLLYIIVIIVAQFYLITSAVLNLLCMLVPPQASWNLQHNTHHEPHILCPQAEMKGSLASAASTETPPTSESSGSLLGSMEVEE